MKYIILILFIFYGVSLSACELETGKLYAGHEVTISKDNQSSSEDCCNEFCACVCCTKIPVTNKINELADIFTNYTNFKVSNTHILSNNYYDHWQPPKAK